MKNSQGMEMSSGPKTGSWGSLHCCRLHQGCYECEEANEFLTWQQEWWGLGWGRGGMLPC